MRPAETNQMYHGYHAYEVGPLKDGYEIRQINFLCNLDVDIRKVCMYCKLKFFFVIRYKKLYKVYSKYKNRCMPSLFYLAI